MEFDTAAYRRDAWISAAILAAILILVFSPFLIGHKTLLSSAGDVPSVYVEGAAVGHSTGLLRGLDQGASGWQTEPAFAASHHIMFGEHRLPFWDADGAYGKPSLGAMVPQQFYPLALAVIAHPTPRVYNWWIVARLFVAGLFAALFVRLFFASRWAAISAGIAAMFTGYFLLYYDMPHLSVEVEIPMLLWATEIVCRRVSLRRVAALASAVALVILGGMPESALLALTLAVLYAVLRLFTLPCARRNVVLALAGAYLLGVAIGSIELVPFIELLVRGASDHDPSVKQGLGYDGNWRFGFLTEFFPRIFGNPYASIVTNGFGPSGVRGFFGMAGFVLGGIALFSAWLKRDSRTVVVTFLTAVVAFFILKRFGNPFVNWSGGLPLFVQVQFQKYGEAELGCAAALLVGFGVGYLRERRGDARSTWLAFGSSIALVSVMYLTTRAAVPDSPISSIYAHSLVFGLIALFIAALGAAGITSPHDRLRLLGSAAVIGILAAEPFAAYLYPVMIRHAPPIDQNPYAGAPYISYLQQQTAAHHERVFGIGAVLFPNWASAFHLSDTRSLEAVTLHDYLPFVDAFVATTPADSDDQFDRFVATKPIDLNRPLVQRWLALSSVGYVLSPIPGDLIAAAPGTVLTPLMDQVNLQIAAADRVAVHQESVAVAGVSESAFFEHPPRDVTFHAHIDGARPRLMTDLAINPGSYLPVVLCGGAVTFTLRAFDGAQLVAQASRTIDPKHVLADRRWIPFALDLTKSAGRTLDVHFQTSAVDTCAAWALWGEPRFVSASAPATYAHNAYLYPLVYQAPAINIFHVTNALQRLTMYHRATGAATFKDAMAQLTAPAFDIYREAVVEGAAPDVAPQAGQDVVTVTSARSDQVTADVTAGSAGLLMQNDAFYPGWKATVDGVDVPIVRADGFFRGIPIAAGHHSVVIAYRSTAALVGSLLSIFGALVLIALFIDPQALRRRRAE